MSPPKRTKNPPPSVSETRVVDLLKCYLGILSDEHQIAPRHLVSTDHLLPLVRSQASSSQAWVDRGWLSQGAATLVGETLWKFLNGKIQLAVDQRQVKLIDA